MNSVDDRLDRYYKIMSEEGVYASSGNLRFYTATLFKDIDFRGKRVLDIGGGKGAFSFYAASAGASEVVCLEPELAGSSEGMTATFKRVQKRLGVADTARVEGVYFQEYESDSKLYDIVIIHNAVNHLDEQACVHLRDSDEARGIYLGLFRKLHDVMAPNGRLIMCDCSNRNVFASLGLKNPFVPTIEWHKHQAPDVWGQLLEMAGLHVKRVSWNSFNSLRGVGRMLLGNKTISYFFGSHFCLVAERGDAS